MNRVYNKPYNTRARMSGAASVGCWCHVDGASISSGKGISVRTGAGLLLDPVPFAGLFVVLIAFFLSMESCAWTSIEVQNKISLTRTRFWGETTSLHNYDVREYNSIFAWNENAIISK